MMFKNKMVKFDNQERLFDLLNRSILNNEKYYSLTQMDLCLEKKYPAIFLKHDVHDVDLDELVKFAERERANGIKGTYFFMSPGHPRIRDSYDFASQLDAMTEIKEMGHELGLHIDPYFQIYEKSTPLKEIIEDIFGKYSDRGIFFNIANIHGNSQHKHLDVNGYGTSFDLFEELARQPDYPELSNIPESSRKLIWRNRCSLYSIGISYWGDMPLWSRNNGFIGTNFISDNKLWKNTTFEVLIRKETTGFYYIYEKPLPGSRNLPENGKYIETGNSRSNFLNEGQYELDYFGGKIEKLFLESFHLTPLLVLIHPEFYC